MDPQPHPRRPPPPPSFLSVSPTLSPQEVRRRMFSEFEAAFPRIIERVYAGDTLSRAVREGAAARLWCVQSLGDEQPCTDGCVHDGTGGAC